MTPSRDNAPFEWESPGASGLLEEAAVLPQPAPGADAALWARVREDTIERRPRPTWQTFALSAATTAAIVIAIFAVVFVLRPSDDRRVVEVGTDVRLEVSQDAALDVLDSAPAAATLKTPASSTTRQVVLMSGELRAKVEKQKPGSRFAVVTPHLRVVVVGTRFTVSVQPDLSRVEVQEGRVRVEMADRSIELGAGEAARSDDPRLQAPVAATAAAVAAAAAATPARTICDPAGADSIACNETLARGEGLAAQNALFQLGLSAEESGDLNGALGRWKELMRRFPAAALVPDAELASLRDLVRLQRYDEALSVAEGFEKRFASDSRSSEVLLIQGKLLCGASGRQAAGIEALTRLQASNDAAEPIRQEALFTLGACQRSAGDDVSAAASWRRSLEQFPSGPHAAEVGRAASAQ